MREYAGTFKIYKPLAFALQYLAPETDGTKAARAVTVMGHLDLQLGIDRLHAARSLAGLLSNSCPHSHLLEVIVLAN